MNKVNIFEGIWRGLFISIGMFVLFSILFTTSNYSSDKKVLLLSMMLLVYIGIFFNLTVKKLFIPIITLTLFSILYLYFFADKIELIKYHEMVFPIICIGLINLGYLKWKKVPSIGIG